MVKILAVLVDGAELRAGAKKVDVFSSSHRHRVVLPQS